MDCFNVYYCESYLDPLGLPYISRRHYSSKKNLGDTYNIGANYIDI